MTAALSPSGMRSKIHRNANHVISSMLPLYILAEGRPRPGNLVWAEIGCFRQNGVEGVMAHLSPIDAVIDSQTRNRNGSRFNVHPIEAIDPRPIIQSHGGWLTIYVVYGYAASNNRLMLNERGDLAPLVQGIHFQIDPSTTGHVHLQLGPRILGWLDRLHEQAGLADRGRIMQEQAEVSPAESLVMANAAMCDIKNPQAKHDDIAQCGIYDPIEARWRFVDFADVDRVACHG